MALQDVVKPGKSYAPISSLTDWGLRTYLIRLRAGDLTSIAKSMDGWNKYADRLAGSAGVATLVDGAVKGSMTNTVQSDFHPWAGDAANAYTLHSKRVVNYGQALGNGMSAKGSSSLGTVLTIAQNALHAALAATNKIHPVTLQEAAGQASTTGQEGFQNQNKDAINQYNGAGNQYNGISSRSFWGDVNSFVTKNQSSEPDLWPHGGNLFTAGGAISPQDAALLNKWFGMVYEEARTMNKALTQTVCDQFNTLASAYVKAYQALPPIPTAPPTKNPSSTNTPQYPPSPATPTNPATPSKPVTTPTTTPTTTPNSPTSPTSTAGLTSPTSTAGLTAPTQTGLTGTSVPTGYPTVSPPTVPDLHTGAFNPDLGHMTTAAGLGTPLVGAGGLGGGAGLRTPKGFGSGLGQTESGLGAGGALGSALPGAAAMEAAEAGMANAANGRGGMPASGAGAGGKGNSKDRTRGVYLPEDEDVWGIEDGVAPPVIGGSW